MKPTGRFVTTGNNADKYLPRQYVEKDEKMRGSLDTSSIPSKLLFGADSDSLSPGPTDKDKFFVTNDNPGSDKGNYISSIQKSNRRIAHEGITKFFKIRFG